jgi:hypothetical protein
VALSVNERNDTEQRKDAILVIPDGVAEVSVSAIKLCELLATALLSSREAVVEVAVDARNTAVTSNDSRVKDVMSMILKTKQLTSFYEQLRMLMKKGEPSDHPALKLVVEGAVWQVAVQEKRGLPNLHLRISKLAAN